MPLLIPVTVELKAVVFVMVQAGPLSCVQVPVPGLGLFPASVILVVPAGRHWSGPAAAVTGPGVGKVVRITLESELPHILEIVHFKV